MSKERKVFDPKAPVVDRRRKEWVELDDGGVWVWEMEFADTLFVREHAVRPGPEGVQRTGSDAVLWQLMVSCRQSEEPNAPRVFELTDMPRLQRLRSSEMQRLLTAVERVNGLGDEDVGALTDFIAAAPGGNRRK